MKPAKLYWPAVFVSMIASFAFEAVWFSVFMNQWLAGIGHSREWLMSPAGYSPTLQFGTALVSALIAAAALSLLTQWTGPQTALRGMQLGVVIWLGFVATGMATEYVFEVRTLSIYLVNAGYRLVDLILIGAITGAWRGKAASE